MTDAEPVFTSAPSTNSRTLIGSVRPWFAENVFPDTSMGSCHVALAVCGARNVTVTSNVSEALFPLASVAVQVTVVVPVPT